MLDHLSLGAKNYPAALIFYDAVFKALECERLYSFGDYAGFGKNGHAFFWLGASSGAQVSEGLHIAFAADSRKIVDAFYAAALAAGATCNGKPGLRPAYHADYYAAFVKDLEGNHIEACCRRSVS